MSKARRKSSASRGMSYLKQTKRYRTGAATPKQRRRMKKKSRGMWGI